MKFKIKFYKPLESGVLGKEDCIKKLNAEKKEIESIENKLKNFDFEIIKQSSINMHLEIHYFNTAGSEVQKVMVYGIEEIKRQLSELGTIKKI